MKQAIGTVSLENAYCWCNKTLIFPCLYFILTQSNLRLLCASLYFEIELVGFDAMVNEFVFGIFVFGLEILEFEFDLFIRI